MQILAYIFGVFNANKEAYSEENELNLVAH